MLTLVAACLAPRASLADQTRLVASLGGSYVTSDAERGTIAIGNSRTGITLGGTGGHLSVLTLQAMGSDGVWQPKAAADSTFLMGSQRVSVGQGALTVTEVRAEDVPGGVRLALVFEAPASHLRVTRMYTSIDDAPGIETWSVIELIGTATAQQLSDIGVWEIRVPASEISWVTGLGAPAVDGGRFTRRQQPLAPNGIINVGSTRRSSETAVPVVWLSGEPGSVFGGLMWSGAWNASVTGPDADGIATLRFSLGQTARTLRPGEAFETPHGFFGATGAGPQAVPQALQTFARRAVHPDRSLGSGVAYNTWFAYGIGVDEATLRAQMERAAALGVELFVVDAGWYVGGTQTDDYWTGAGNWRADARRFPSGLGRLADYAHGLGLKFGLWVEPERFDLRLINQAGLARESWLAMTGGRYDPDLKNSSATSGLLCFGSAEVRQWILAQLNRLVDEAHLDYLKWDNNYWINCDRGGHGHESKDGNLAHILGLYEVLASLRATHPDLLIENCASGGNRLDFGLLRYTDTAWMDDQSAPSAHVRHNVQGLAAIFPAEYLVSFVTDHPAEPVHGNPDTALTFRSRQPGSFGLSVRIEEFGEDQRDAMSREIALAKQLRGTVPDGVTLLLTNQAGTLPDPAWDAVQVLAPALGQSVLFTYAATGASAWETIWPIGLNPATDYVVRTTNGHELLRASGADLLRDGMVLPRRPASAANTLVIEPAPPTAPQFK